MVEHACLAKLSMCQHQIVSEKHLCAQSVCVQQLFVKDIYSLLQRQLLDLGIHKRNLQQYSLPINMTL